MNIQEGNVAVITGAASGIGFALCKELAARSARLVMADINEELLQQSASEIGGEDRVVARRCDVSLADDVAALRTCALDAFGRVDMIVNNAGVVLPFRPMWEHGDKDWDWLLRINLSGVINGIRAFVPGFVAQGSGHVVNTASMAGVTVIPFNGVYNASKHAVVSLTETLAAELAQRAPGVHATVVCPGLVPTGIGAKGPPNSTLSRKAIAPEAVPHTIDVALAAARIIAGVEADKVYVFTNPGARERIEARFSGIRNAMEEWN